jgi:hypothetical protein
MDAALAGPVARITANAAMILLHKRAELYKLATKDRLVGTSGFLCCSPTWRCGVTGGSFGAMPQREPFGGDENVHAWARCVILVT